MTILAYPQLLWLLFLPAVVYFLYPAARKMYGDALQVPFVDDIIEIKDESGSVNRAKSGKAVFFKFKLLLFFAVWCMFVLALCRPQWVGQPHKTHQSSRDIMLVVDISQSMLARDFEYQGRIYDRLNAVKSVVGHFADERTDDRIGLVVFGTRAYQQVPLTFDRQSLKEVLYAIDAGMAGNSTSIGDAVGLALKNLAQDENPAQNKVIILLTDGENNDGRLSFLQATQLAEKEDVKIYTIGMANDKELFFGGLFAIPADSGLDEQSLQRLSDATKGQYFRVKDVRSLYEVYDKINQIEAQDKEGRFVQEKKDLFYWPAAAGLLLFLIIFVIVGRK